MAVTEQFTCDVCGKAKQQTNHWWMASEGGGDLLIHKWDKDSIKDCKHLCGQECVIKAVSEWMQK